MDGLPKRKHFLWLVGVAALGLTAQWALPPLRHGRLEDPTVVFLVGAAGLLGTAVFWTARDVARRWRVWQRRRMSPWQRRVRDEGGAPGFGVVIAATPEHFVDAQPRAVRPFMDRPASRRFMLLAAIVVIWTVVALLLVALVADVLVPLVGAA